MQGGIDVKYMYMYTNFGGSKTFYFPLNLMYLIPQTQTHTLLQCMIILQCMIYFSHSLPPSLLPSFSIDYRVDKDQVRRIEFTQGDSKSDTINSNIMTQCTANNSNASIYVDR